MERNQLRAGVSTTRTTPSAPHHHHQQQQGTCERDSSFSFLTSSVSDDLERLLNFESAMTQSGGGGRRLDASICYKPRKKRQCARTITTRRRFVDRWIKRLTRRGSVEGTCADVCTEMCEGFDTSFPLPSCQMHRPVLSSGDEKCCCEESETISKCGHGATCDESQNSCKCLHGFEDMDSSSDPSNQFCTISVEGPPPQDSTASPTSSPTSTPTEEPTQSPTSAPTMGPTKSPATDSPTHNPTSAPTAGPTKSPVTGGPTQSPSSAPSTKSPTGSPTSGPTSSPEEDQDPDIFVGFTTQTLPTTTTTTTTASTSCTVRFVNETTGSDQSFSGQEYANLYPTQVTYDAIHDGITCETGGGSIFVSGGVDFPCGTSAAFSRETTFSECDKMDCRGGCSGGTIIEGSNSVECGSFGSCALSSITNLKGPSPSVLCNGAAACSYTNISAAPAVTGISTTIEEEPRLECIGNFACTAARVDFGADRGVVICSGDSDYACIGTVVNAKCLICKNNDESSPTNYGCQSGNQFQDDQIVLGDYFEGFCGDCTGVPEAAGMTRNLCSP